MNPIILENIMSSITFILLVVVLLLFAALTAILFRTMYRSSSAKADQDNLQMFQKIFDNASVAALVIDNKGHIELVNRVAQKSFSKSQEELEGTLLDAFTMISSSPKRFERFKNTLKDNGTYSFDASIRTMDGPKEYSFNFSSIPYSDTEKYVVGMSEKTDSNQSEYIRDLQNARLDEVENTAGIGFWVYDYNTNSVIFSRGLYAILGADINSTKPSLNFLDRFQEDEDHVAQNILVAIKNQSPFNARAVLNGYDGQTRIVDVYLRHNKDRDMSMRSSIGIVRDATHRENLIQKLQTSEEYLYAIANARDIFLILTDDKGIIQETNLYTREVLEKEENELVGKPINLFFGKTKQYLKSNNLSSTLAFITPLNDLWILWQQFRVIGKNKDAGVLNFGINLSSCARYISDLERTHE